MKKTSKKILLFITIFLLVNNAKMNAQATDASASTGNTFGPLKFLGWKTGSIGDLPFKINGSTIMTLTSNGSVVIGTTNNPQYKFEVIGESHFAQTTPYMLIPMAVHLMMQNLVALLEALQ